MKMFSNIYEISFNIIDDNSWVGFLFYSIYTGCPKKKQNAQFSLLAIRFFFFFFLYISSDKTLSSEKNDTKIIEIGGVVLILG